MQDDVDRLFAVGSSEFVRERNALADRLKGEGRAQEAADVRRLRRPRAVVWALNRLARSRPDDLGALVEADERVREVQQQGEGGLLREATREVQVLARGPAAAPCAPPRSKPRRSSRSETLRTDMSHLSARSAGASYLREVVEKLHELRKSDLLAVSRTRSTFAPLNRRLADPQMALVIAQVVRNGKGDAVVPERYHDVV